MTQAEFPDLPPWAFAKRDPAPDALFYAEARLVTHIDAAAVAAVTALYRMVLPAGGAILDLMSSWVSHLPEDIAYAEVVGHGLNAAELDANPRLTRRLVQDLNADSRLPLATGAFDAATLCVGVQYLERPVAVFGEVARVLRPGAPVIAILSDRCFPTKAVAIWTALGREDRARLVLLAMDRAGLVEGEARVLVPAGGSGDALIAVMARAPAAGPAGLAQDDTPGATQA